MPCREPGAARIDGRLCGSPELGHARHAGLAAAARRLRARQAAGRCLRPAFECRHVPVDPASEGQKGALGGQRAPARRRSSGLRGRDRHGRRAALSGSAVHERFLLHDLPRRARRRRPVRRGDVPAGLWRGGRFLAARLQGGLHAARGRQRLRFPREIAELQRCAAGGNPRRDEGQPPKQAFAGTRRSCGRRDARQRSPAEEPCARHPGHRGDHPASVAAPDHHSDRGSWLGDAAARRVGCEPPCPGRAEPHRRRRRGAGARHPRLRRARDVATRRRGAGLGRGAAPRDPPRLPCGRQCHRPRLARCARRICPKRDRRHAYRRVEITCREDQGRGSRRHDCRDRDRRS